MAHGPAAPVSPPPNVGQPAAPPDPPVAPGAVETVEARMPVAGTGSGSVALGGATASAGGAAAGVKPATSGPGTARSMWMRASVAAVTATPRSAAYATASPSAPCPAGKRAPRGTTTGPVASGAREKARYTRSGTGPRSPSRRTRW